MHQLLKKTEFLKYHLKSDGDEMMLFVWFVNQRVAEKLLPGSRFHRYIRDGETLVRSSAPYFVHDDVHQHLDFGENKYLSVIYTSIFLSVTGCITVLLLHSGRASSLPP